MSKDDPRPILGGGQGDFDASAQSILIHEVKSVPIELERREMAVFARRRRRLEVLASRCREFARWLVKVDQKRADKLSECGSWLLFHHYFTHPDAPVRMAGGVFCQQALLCDFCAAGRASRQGQAVADAITDRIAAHRHLRPYMVTLTIRSRQDLAEAVRVVWSAWSKLVQRRRNSIKGKNDSVMGLFDGGFVHAECKRSKGAWHYHLHGLVLADLDRYAPVRSRLTREWAKAAGQEWASTQLDPIRGLGRDGLMSALRETIKYAVKADAEMSFDERYQAFGELSRVRSLRTFGSLYGAKVPDQVQPDDLADVDGYEFRELWLNYIERRGYVDRSREVQSGEYAGICGLIGPDAGPSQESGVAGR